MIIGAGVAGLYTAMNLPRDMKVLIVNKAHPWECNTFYAQGGVTTAKDSSDIPLHIKDTLDAGAGLCDREAVEVLSQNSQDVIHDLIARGFQFDADEEGKLLYTQEAAHSQKRILHAGGDATGRYLHHFLLEKNPHPMLENAIVIDLLLEKKQVCGIVVMHRGERKEILSHAVVIASGGVGALFEYHTNASSISGELHGICLEKGIELENMEMLQFHPTVYVNNNTAQKQLLTEALRGEGAQVVDDLGYRFLFDYDERGEMAPRDIVSRAIFDYAQKTQKQVYLSFTSFDYDYFKHRFPNIESRFSALGYNLPKDKVPVSPAFHYAIGGIKTDLNGHTPSIRGLYAVGEAASTGVHGANRLASNSLLEGLVFAKRAAQALIREEGTRCEGSYTKNSELLDIDGDKEKKEQLRHIMWEQVSIVRTTKGLQDALEAIEKMLSEPIGRLLKLRLLTAREIVRSAVARKESVGVHYRQG
ncbi:MAG: L-aspartate oxidase [Thiovulaceae bacterium]|nr:L-aspartate oxidase [Sulfurimonadaceae bacterium]